MPQRRFVLALIAALLLAGGGWTTYWFDGAERLRAGVLAWAEARRAAGDAVALGEVTVSGFPLRFDLALSAPSVGTRQDGEPLLWQGPPSTVTFRPWTYDRFTFDAPGLHRIVHGEPDVPTPILLEAARAGGTGRLAPDGRLAILALSFAEVRVGSETTPDKVRMDRADALLRLPAAAGLTDPAARAEPGKPGDSGALRLEVTGLALPEGVGEPLGNTVDRLFLLGGLRGVVPHVPPDDALVAWRDAGGTVEIYDHRVDWGALHLSATGTVALDAEMRPIGALIAKLRGYAETLDALVVAGAMKRRAAEIAKFILSMMAEWPDENGEPVLIVPLSAQDGILSVGPISLFRLPPLRWERPRSE